MKLGPHRAISAESFHPFSYVNADLARGGQPLDVEQIDSKKTLEPWPQRAAGTLSTLEGPWFASRLRRCLICSGEWLHVTRSSDALAGARWPGASDHVRKQQQR